MSFEEQTGPAKAPRRIGWRNLLGKLWNAPNTAIGLIYGALGAAAGGLAHAIGGAPKPRIFWRDNAVQFTNNPFGGLGAITLGNTTIWTGDPYDPLDRVWHDDGVPRRESRTATEPGHTYPEHEIQHTYQGEQLGPVYLPSNLLGGLTAVLRGEGWHGPSNWNERGPQRPNPVPWARKP